ncbi:MAG: SMI1/KNR4 family protein [Clostridia bacterium]|nr:SMI1/KNR4 family protein [Clostridia bacterium]
MSKFKELYDTLPNTEWVNFSAPASKEDIASVKNNLGVYLPDELYRFYLESNGDDCAIFPVSRLISENQDLRKLSKELYMPLDCLLLFGDNGCGDYFGYPIIGGETEEHRIYMWVRDTDERILVANTLEEFIGIYYGNEEAGNQVLGARM